MRFTTLNEWKSFKALNESNNIDLPTMYHGTNNEFKDFNLSLFGSSDNGWLGKGIYFTNDYDYAKSYTDIDVVKEVKLHIKNPYIITDSTYSRRPDKLREEFNANNSTELTKKLKNIGYDSVVLKTEDDTYDKNNQIQKYFYEVCVFNIEDITIINESLNENSNTIYTGIQVNQHITNITPDESDLPDYFMNNFIKDRKFTIEEINLNDLLNSDESFKEYYESGEQRYEEDEVEYRDLDNELVIVDGKLLDGYSRATQLLNNGETTAYAYVALQNTNEAKDKNYLSWKRKNVTMRGISENTDDSGFNGSGARFGDGLYTASLSNKSMAKGYGTLYFVVGARPKNPKIFKDTNNAEIWIYNNLYKQYKNVREFNANTNIKDDMLKLGYDGLEIVGREIVNYTPDNDTIKYFKNEEQLENYYNDTISINESSNKLNIFNITFINSKFAITINTVNSFIKLIKNIDENLVYNEKTDSSTNKYLNSFGNFRDIKIKSKILNVGIINELAKSFIEKYDWLKIKTIQSKY